MVISEVMRPEPNIAVAAWLRTCAPEDLFVSAITVMEISYGIRRLAPGIRRQRLASAASSLFSQEFHDRVLAFDALTAELCAEIRAGRHRAGRPITNEDAMIAATARANDAAIATRDRGGFEACGIELINPWHD